MAFCSGCGTEVSEGTGFCPKCGKPMGASAGGGAAAAPAPAATSGLQDNVASALAYIVIAAIIFLVSAPYNTNKTIRFHSFQSIAYCVVWIAVNFIWMVPFLGLFLAPLIHFVMFLGWLFLVFQAYSGKKFKLPVIGDWAEKQADQ